MEIGDVVFVSVVMIRHNLIFFWLIFFPHALFCNFYFIIVCSVLLMLIRFVQKKFQIKLQSHS